MFTENENFHNARTILTFWYCLILFLILTVFSLVLYSTENRSFTRIVIQRDFGANIPQTVTAVERRIILQQVQELRRSFTITILFIDGLVLIIGGALSFFLAEKTLKPIQESLQQQKEFLADASHELRTPLAAIQTTCEVVLRGKHKSIEDYRNVIRQTYDETIRLSSIANDLLQLSRIDSGVIPLQKHLVVLDILVKEIIPQIEPLMAKKNITFSKQLTEHVTITADKDRIKQLLMIFFDNAIKFTPEGGTVSIIVKANPKSIIQIIDSGIGMTTTEKGKIFRRFYQAEHSRTNTGAGLGLSIAKWIADSHNASIKVVSEKGKGSSFTIIFPSQVSSGARLNQ